LGCNSHNKIVLYDGLALFEHHQAGFLSDPLWQSLIIIPLVLVDGQVADFGIFDWDFGFIL
jgi:hypothetical protein